MTEPPRPAVHAGGNRSRACLQGPVVTGALWLSIDQGHKTSRDGQALQTQPRRGGLRCSDVRVRGTGRTRLGVIDPEPAHSTMTAASGRSKARRWTASTSAGVIEARSAR